MDYLFYSPESKLFGLTIFVTVVVFQMAFITWQWFYERRTDYLYYLAYMFAAVCYGLSEFEEFLPFKLFTHITENFKYYTNHFLPSFSIFLYYRFARAFLNLPETRPKLNLYVKRLEFFIVFLSITSLLLRISGVSWIFVEYYFLSGTAMIVMASAIIIANFLKNSTPLSRFAMLGAACLLTGSAITFVLLIVENMGYRIVFDPYLPLLIFVIAELLVFTTGLTFKSRLLEKEKFETEQALLKEFKHRQQLELQMFQVRENISRDLHDEIGSGLTKISFLGEVIKREKVVGDSKIDTIISTAKDMVKAMGEMIWTINKSNDTLEDTIYFLRRQILEYCEDMPVEINLEIPDQIPEYELSGIQRRNIFLVLKEALNNALKHSGGNKIDVCFRVECDRLYVSVKDNGIGVTPENMKSSGNGIRNMHARMKEIDGRFEIVNKEGTKLLLEVPLKKV